MSRPPSTKCVIRWAVFREGHEVDCHYCPIARKVLPALYRTHTPRHHSITRANPDVGIAYIIRKANETCRPLDVVKIGVVTKDESKKRPMVTHVVPPPNHPQE